MGLLISVGLICAWHEFFFFVMREAMREKVGGENVWILCMHSYVCVVECTMHAFFTKKFTVLFHLIIRYKISVYLSKNYTKCCALKCGRKSFFS